MLLFGEIDNDYNFALLSYKKKNLSPNKIYIFMMKKKFVSEFSTCRYVESLSRVDSS